MKETDRGQAVLQSQLASGRISHAYIFNSKDKKYAMDRALEFATRLLSMDEDNGSVEDIRDSEDLRIIEPAGNVIPIDRIRELIRYLRFRPYRGRYKVVILEEAEKLRKESANALLKTMEEMPSYGVIILLIDSHEKLLPTIRSRCQLIRFDAEHEMQTELDRSIVRDLVDQILMDGALTVYENRKAIEEMKSSGAEFFRIVIEYLGEIYNSIHTGICRSERIENLLASGNLNLKRLEEAIESAVEIESRQAVNLNFLLSVERLAFRLQEIMNKRII